MTTIRRFIDPTEAGIVAAFLKDNEIDAVLLDENSSSYTYARILIPIRLQVPSQQAEAASVLLKQFEAMPREKGENQVD